MAISAEHITERLLCWSQGEERALDELLPVVYPELRRLARYLLKGQRSNHTLQPTALVNEAYLKFAGGKKQQWTREHFFAVAACAMRQVLKDYARKRSRAKRQVVLISLDEPGFPEPPGVAKAFEDILSVDKALERLAAVDVRRARMLELRFFGGLTNEEIAKVLQISPNTVMRDWSLAQAWLRRELDKKKNDISTVEND